MDRDKPGILLPIPLPADRVFRNQAMDDILELLYRNPHDTFGVRQLRDVTGHGAQTVDTALTLFTQLDLIETQRQGNKKLISINRDRVQKPDDLISRSRRRSSGHRSKPSSTISETTSTTSSVCSSSGVLRVVRPTAPATSTSSSSSTTS